MPALRKLRQRWLSIHLYLGLIFAFFLGIAGITGSLLVFYIELDEWINPKLIAKDTSSPYLSYQKIFDAIKASEPNRSGAWRLEIPEQKNRMISARFYKPTETHDHNFAPLMLHIDPFTAEIVSKRLWGQYLMTWIYDLHYTLLLETPGKWLMALTGLSLLISLISGLYLWWPSHHKWLTAISLKRNSSKQRLNYDIHKLSGIYSYLVLVTVAVTGIALEIPDYINPVINHFSPIERIIKPLSNGSKGDTPISLDQAVAKAQEAFPETPVSWIETPDGDTGSIRVNFRQKGEPSQRFPKTNVWIDQYSGNLLSIQNPFKQTGGTQIIHWLHPLHSGEALGLIGRILVSLSGLSLTALIITGMIRWFNKQAIRKQKTP